MINEDLLLCNCAGCGKELLGLGNPPGIKRKAGRGDYPPLVGGRINGRPYCATCLNSDNSIRRVHNSDCRKGRNGSGEWNGSADNGVRAMEEA